MVTTVLCSLAELEPTGARGVVLGSGREARSIVVVCTPSGRVRAYENSCPHLGIPLEIAPDRFLDLERRHLVCSMHGARFAANDGLCVSGPCEGHRLGAFAVDVSADGVVSLAEAG